MKVHTALINGDQDTANEIAKEYVYIKGGVEQYVGDRGVDVRMTKLHRQGLEFRGDDWVAS